MRSLRHPERIERALAKIARNRRSGASELAADAVRVFALVRPVQGASVSGFVRDVSRLGKRVVGSRPTLAPIASAVERLLAEFTRDAAKSATVEAAHAALRRAGQHQHQELEAVGRKVTRHFIERFGRLRRPMLISYSARVTGAIGALRSPRVMVCESRPSCEGRRTARLLRPLAARVTVITESQAGRAMEECDSVVLGCDAIHADGSIVNKAGSYLLALAACDRGRPVIVLGDTYKMTRRVRIAGERHAATEVWPKAPRGIVLRNDAFERVPGRLVDYIVLESGVFKAKAIKRAWSKAV
jgi:translation initiation factor 2B subunit (eIF-2B alpha/beta/delta family)